jgi:predicted anti-sigma-YlaC factor YlaD
MLVGLPKELVPVLIGGAIGILGTFAAWLGVYVIH